MVPWFYQRLKGKLRSKTYVRIAGRWVYLFRAVDGHGDTVDFYLSERRDREAAKAFFAEGALSNPDNRPSRLLYMDGNPSYPAAIRDLEAAGRLSPHCQRRSQREVLQCSGLGVA